MIKVSYTLSGNNLLSIRRILFWMSGFQTDKEGLSKEEQDEIIQRVLRKIRDYEMETVAILSLESIKPLAYVGGEMSKVFILPFLSILGSDLNNLSGNLITVFEDKANVEKLIKLLEEGLEEKTKKGKEALVNNKRRRGLFSWWPF